MTFATFLLALLCVAGLEMESFELCGPKDADRVRTYGFVLDFDDEPIAEAQVKLEGGRPGTSRISVPRTETDSRGRFRFNDLEAGTYSMSVWADGYEVIEIPGLELEAGPEPIDLGTVILAESLFVEGRVVDHHAQPLLGAEITIVNIGSRRGIANARGKSKEGGSFRIGNLSPGEKIVLRVAHDGYQPLTAQIVVPQVPEPVELVLLPGCTLGRRIFDPEGRPDDEATVLLERNSGIGSSSQGAAIGAGRRVSQAMPRDSSRQVTRCGKFLEWIKAAQLGRRPRTGREEPRATRFDQPPGT